MEIVKNSKAKENLNSNKQKVQNDIFNPSAIPIPFSLNDFNDQFIQETLTFVPEKSIETTSSSQNNKEKNFKLNDDIVLKINDETLSNKKNREFNKYNSKIFLEESSSSLLQNNKLQISDSNIPAISIESVPNFFVEKNEKKVKYPSLRETTTDHQLFSESELLSEEQLLEYYKNDQLDFVDDFIDLFVQLEIEPKNCLHELIKNFKEVCEILENNETSKNNCANLLSILNNEVWEVKQKTINQKGKCDCGKSASGESFYKIANFKPEKLVLLSQEMKNFTNIELDIGFCQEIRLRALALQIQWIVVDINTNFFSEHQLSVNSIPTLIKSPHSLPSRIKLRQALSDLFYFIRFPVLVKRFRDSITSWIMELSSVLLRACTSDDQLFFLSHILRSPSPLTGWGVSLIQTFISTPALDLSIPINSFVACFSALLRPIKCRDQFLFFFTKYYEGENAWNSVDYNGSMENTNMADILETDLIEILAQFSIKTLFSVFLKNFTIIYHGNRLQVILSLISFVLVLLKICDDGIKVYINYKNMCKKICDNIKTLVQSFCTYWDLIKFELNPSDYTLIQNEINRIVLQSIYYIISKNNLDLWQFLIDFPFKSVTEFCRIRCQILIRNNPIISVKELYEINDNDLISKIKSYDKLNNQLKDTKKDMTYKILTLSSIISNCDLDQNFLVLQIIDFCFLDEINREYYYKVGSDAVSLFLEKNPNLLSVLLKYIDRHIDDFDNYALNILSHATKSLVNCKLSSDDISNILGKWLINRSLSHPASHIARKVLSSVNWGKCQNELWMGQEAHDVCAETIVKSHIVNCKTYNGMIAKSFNKAAKLALKCTNLEQQFDKFCWDLLIKLKISAKPLVANPTNDLTAYYLFIQQKCLSSYKVFLEHGLKIFIELVNASCFKALVVILAQLVFNFDHSANMLILNQNFCECLERIIHADESAYALQLIVKTNDFPGLITSLIASAIQYQLYVEETLMRKKKLALTWLEILTCKKSLEWNADKFVLYLIGIIIKCALYYDSESIFGIEKIFQSLYNAQFLAWKESMKSPFSWFSSNLHPPIIHSNLFFVSPWATFLLLKVESNFFEFFYEYLNNSLCKHPQRTLEDSLKKTTSKSCIYFTIERLHFARWLEFAIYENIYEQELFPLILQQLCCILFARNLYKNNQYCCGLRLLKCQTTKGLFLKLKDIVLPKAEKSATDLKLKNFFRAVSQWIFAEEIYSIDFNRFTDYDLDYLLQMAIVSDKHFWMDFVDKDKIEEKILTDTKLFANSCYLNDFVDIFQSNFNIKINSLTSFFKSLEVSFNISVPIPAIPQHKNLPIYERYETNWYNTLESKINLYLGEIKKIAKSFVSGKEAVDALNQTYLDDFQKLYSETNTTLQIVLKCSNFMISRCSKSSNLDVSITTSTYDQSIATKMNENRSKREEKINQLFLVLDFVAIQCAQLEHISYTLNQFLDLKKLNDIENSIQSIGVNVFYKICNFIDGIQFLFPAAVSCYECCIEKLGKTFIANNPNEQLNLMRIVKNGSLLNHLLVLYFTPHCVSPELLFQLYSELSNSIQDAKTSESSLALLSRLDIENANNRMSSNQFILLMPIIFENIAYVSNTSPFCHLCVQHFIHSMFHHFPSNIFTGFRLILSGLDSQAVPEDLFLKIMSRFENFEFILKQPYSLNYQDKMLLSSEQAIDCLKIFSTQLKSSKCLLNARFYTVWKLYLESICKIASYFVRCIVYQTFNSELSTLIIEKELKKVFYIIISIWGILFEHNNNGLPVWTATDNNLANLLLDQFVSCLNWLPYNVYLPPGSENIECLFLQYFTSKCLNLQRAGNIHVYSVYESKIVRLNWTRLWPTLLDLNAIEKVLINGPTELYLLITEIILRIPWLQVIQHQITINQPEESHRAFHSLILSIFSRCICKPSNYIKSRASMESLLKFFLERLNWHYTKLDKIENVSEFIIACFPKEVLTNSDEILKTFMSIWSKVCFFSTIQKHNIIIDNDQKNICQKQAIYVKTHLNLMLNSTMDFEKKQKFYKEILTKINQLIILPNKLIYICIIKEIIAFWAKVSKEEETLFMKILTDWLNAHCESEIILLLMNIIMDSLPINLGLKLLDSCILIYFQRKLSCNWTEVLQWLNIPEKTKQWLYTTPKRDSEIKPCFFVLNAHLMNEMSQLKSADEECKILNRVAEYVSSIKPKYILNEGAFILCIEKWQRMLIRQYTNGVSLNISNERLENYLKWLRKLYNEEKSSSLFAVVAKFGAKKPSYSTKLQLFLNIIDLYITQQKRVNQPPRLDSNDPVLNSRIHAFNELKQQKQYQELINDTVFYSVSKFFTETKIYNMNHVMDLFSIIIQKFYPNEKYLQSF